MTSFGKVLARAVEKHPVLYNHAAQTTAKKDDYDEAWQAVADECDKPVSVIKGRWSKTIKSLIQHLSNPQPKNNARKTRSSEFQLLDELKFLLPYLNSDLDTWENLNDSVEDAAETRSNESTAVDPLETLPKTTISKTAAATTKQRDSSTDSCNDDIDDLVDATATPTTMAKTVKANAANMAAIFNDKRKRELSKTLLSNGKTSQAVQAVLAAAEKRKSDGGNYFVTESMTDNLPSIRFRRIFDEPPQQHKQPSTQQQQQQKPSNANETKPTAGKVNKIMRSRSRSMYMERKEEGDNDNAADNLDEDDEDADYRPPPRKKIAMSKSETRSPKSVKTRGKATRLCAASIKNAALKSPLAEKRTRPTSAASASSSASSASFSKQTSKQTLKQASVAHDTSAFETKHKIEKGIEDEVETDADAEFGSGIDMSMIEAAAAAEAAAAIEAATPIYGTDAVTQCSYEADEEDDEFLERTRLWLQRMNPRQKLVFRKGVYQAFLDVYDDPRNFELPKGSDKFMMTQMNGMPALFTGMSPIELRLVRQLAIAVTGSKLNSTATHVVGGVKYGGGNQDVKCQSPAALPRGAHQQQQQSSPPTNAASSFRTHGMVEKYPAVLRTTAIALSNQTRTPSGMQRVLRKVVRVDNSGSGGGGGGSSGNDGTSPNNAGGSNSSSGNSSSHNIGGNVRARTVCVTSNNGNNPQRVYRILPNGNIMRHNPVQSSSNNSNNTNNSATATQQASTSTLTTSTGTVITTRNISKPNQQPVTHTQMLVDPKTGYCVRRQYVSMSNGGSGGETEATETVATTQKATRPPMSRRYSICSVPRELKQQQQQQATATATSNEQNESLRWNSFGKLSSHLTKQSQQQQQQKLLPKSATATATNSAASASSASAGAASASANVSPKPIVRVRYAQNQAAAAAAAAGSGAASPASAAAGANQFALPAAVSPRRQQQQRDSPVPVLITSSSSLNAAAVAGGAAAATSDNKDNTDVILKRAQQVYENALLSEERAGKANQPTTAGNTANNNRRRNVAAAQQNRTQADKANCLITSDMIDDFVVKNEPLDEDDDDLSAEYVED